MRSPLDGARQDRSASSSDRSKAPARFEDAVAALKDGKAVVFPTDTVYGIGVAVDYAETPEDIYRIKERSHDKPIAWLVGGVDDIRAYGSSVPDSVMRIARTFWPGSLTIIVAASERVPSTYTSSAGTIGLRAPASATVQRLIRRVGCPLATSSANIAGGPSPHSFDEVNPIVLERCACALRDDTPKSGIASTVIDCSSGTVKMIRQGAVLEEDIKACL